MNMVKLKRMYRIKRAKDVRVYSQYLTRHLCYMLTRLISPAVYQISRSTLRYSDSCAPSSHQIKGKNRCKTYYRERNLIRLGPRANNMS